MTIQISNNPKPDISLLAIEAAEELERSKRSLSTNFKSVKAISIILKKSFSKKAGDSEFNYRLDHASVFSNALSNSIGQTVVKKTISEIANEAMKIALLLESDKKNSKGEELNMLISFCIALSDSAALYKEEIEELKKHFV